MRKKVFLGAASIFALSMIALFASTAMAADAPKIDTGDNAWMLASSALVLIMTPGLALFYGGYGKGKKHGEYHVDEFYRHLYCKCAMGALGV